MNTIVHHHNGMGSPWAMAAAATLFGAVMICSAWSSPAWAAQKIIRVAQAESTTPATIQPLPEIGTDQLAVFVLQRGFYVTTDLGAFFTFSGTRGYSNIQPFMAVKAGYDLNNWLSLQLAVATGFSSGNPLNNANQQGVGVTSYSIFNLGGEVVGSFRPTERFAIEPVLGGGMTRLNPSLYKTAGGVTYSPYTGHVDAGVQFKYLTLLTDFSAGASVMAYYFFNVNVPALSIAFNLRYTF